MIFGTLGVYLPTIIGFGGFISARQRCGTRVQSGTQPSHAQPNTSRAQNPNNLERAFAKSSITGIIGGSREKLYPARRSLLVFDFDSQSRVIFLGQPCRPPFPVQPHVLRESFGEEPFRVH